MNKDPATNQIIYIYGNKKNDGNIKFKKRLGFDQNAGLKKRAGATKRSGKIFGRFIGGKIKKMIEFLFAGLLQCAMIQDMTQFGLCLDELVNNFNLLQNTQDEEIISKTN